MMENNYTDYHNTILIVDDQPVNIQALSKLLKDSYHILAATNGAKAIEIALGENMPDLILLDINMPDMDGYEVCRQLKSNPKTKAISIIFITALSEPEEEEKGFLVGADDYIMKPFQPVSVRARVRNQINLKTRTALLEKLALVDGLTGIANRYSYETSLQRAWKQCARNNEYLTIAMIDIDYFKAFNDNYGHGAGDECLRQIAQTLKKTLSRPMDIIARYGGEEFVAILPNTDHEGAIYITHTILNAIRNIAIPHAFSSVAKHVTISIGFASTNQFNKNSPQNLAQESDKALYLAKEYGRNQVQNITPPFS